MESIDYTNYLTTSRNKIGIETIKNIYDKLIKGKNAKEISSQLNISLKTVYRWMKKLENCDVSESFFKNLINKVGRKGY